MIMAMGRPAIDVTGQRFGRLIVLERVPGPSKHPKYLAQCDCGETTQATSTNLRSGDVRSCGCLRREVSAGLIKQVAHLSPRSVPGQERVEVPTYRAMHLRLDQARGKASEHPCADCGGPATEWSYDGQDPMALVGTKNGSRVTYSLNPIHYDPRCTPCHRAFDAAQRREGT